MNANSPRYILYSFKFTRPDGRVQYPLVLIFFMPSSAPDRARMLYASVTNTVSETLQIAKVFHFGRYFCRKAFFRWEFFFFEKEIKIMEKLFLVDSLSLFFFLSASLMKCFFFLRFWNSQTWTILPTTGCAPRCDNARQNAEVEEKHEI